MKLGCHDHAFTPMFKSERQQSEAFTLQSSMKPVSMIPPPWSISTLFSLNYLSNKIDRMSVISNRLIPYYSTHPTFESDSHCMLRRTRMQTLNSYACLGTVALYASSLSSLNSLGCGDASCPVIIAVSFLNCSPCSGLVRTF